MKQVEIIESIASADFAYGAGEKPYLDDDLANAWIKSGIAKEVKETTTQKPRQTTTTKTTKEKATKNPTTRRKKSSDE